MTKIRLYNTRSRTKEDFVPLDPSNVRMYVCGPTVYDRAHLGNARPVVVFDVLFRLLRHVYGEAGVTYVRNFTDVDDKINARAAETGRPIGEITDETIGWFHQDMDALGALRPTHEPRATEWIGAMVAMIQDLMGRGHAYEAEGHVLFAVESYSAYGRLSGRTVEDMIAGARVEVAPYKKNPMDFVLWKPSTPDLPGWESPWGRGRPGWHIECSAMAHEILGASFDIHAGGMDLMFPHHENEIAQSMCAHPEGGFAQVWLHNEMLQVEGRKMSKSLGNFFTVRDLLDQGVPGEVIRFVMLSTHYRKPMDWTAEKAREAEATLRKWRDLVGDLQPAVQPAERLLLALSDDLKTAGAISVLHEIAEAIRNVQNNVKPGARNVLHLPDWLMIEGVDNHPLSVALELKRLLKASAKALGLLEDGMGQWADSYEDVPTEEFSARVEYWILKRAEAKRLKDFNRADEIRRSLAVIGVILSDTPEGTTWFIDATSEEIGRWELLE